MQRKAIDYKDILSMFLPKGMLDYFDFTDYSDMGEYYLFTLEEKNNIPEEYSGVPLVSKGFYPEMVVTDFPVRDRTRIFKGEAQKMGGQDYRKDLQQELEVGGRRG